MDNAITAPAPATPPALYLASQSPRRGQLLEQIGVRYTPLLADAHEDAKSLETPLPEEAPRDYVIRVVAAKMAAALERHARRGLPVAPILCADTTVTLDGRLLGKPADADDAGRMLRLLSGREHEVLTAVSVAVPAGLRPEMPAASATSATWSVLSVSRVRFGVLSDNEIAAYIASGEPFGKAGACSMQGRGAAFVAHLSGSYSGVLGLPLYETAGLLRKAGTMAYDVTESARNPRK